MNIRYHREAPMCLSQANRGGRREGHMRKGEPDKFYLFDNEGYQHLEGPEWILRAMTSCEDSPRGA